MEAGAVPKILRVRPPQDENEQQKVRRLARARHAPADWIERAQIITLSWDGLEVAAIAAKLGSHPKKVRRWLHRFNADGIEGLGNRPGCGRKRRITEDERSAIIALACADPPGRLARDWASGELAAQVPDGPGEWTLDSLTQTARDIGIDIGRSQVRRILLQDGGAVAPDPVLGDQQRPRFAPKERPSWSSRPPRRRALR
jgi:transposase